MSAEGVLIRPRRGKATGGRNRTHAWNSPAKSACPGAAPENGVGAAAGASAAGASAMGSSAAPASSSSSSSDSDSDFDGDESARRDGSGGFDAMKRRAKRPYL